MRRRALDALRTLREGSGVVSPLPSVDVLHEMMSFSLGQEVPPEYVPMMLQDMGLPEREVMATPGAPAGFRVLVIGAGVGGLLAAIKLGQAGIEHTVIEKNADLGGTWFENSYPGCRVDLPSHFYSYSFEPDHDWREHYARRDEILGCLGLLLPRGRSAMECKEAVHDEFNARVDAAHARMVWAQPNVKNWFRSAAGRVATHSPFRLVDYWAMTRAPEPADFTFE